MSTRQALEKVKNGFAISSNCGNIQLEYYKGKFQLRHITGFIESGITFSYGFYIINKK